MKYAIGIYIAAVLLVSCTMKAPEVKENPVASPEQLLAPYAPLSWGNVNWSDYVQMAIELDHLDTLDQAKDIPEFCPKYATLDKYQRIHVWGEFISAMAKFESNWKPETVYKECSKSCQYSGGCQKVGNLYCMKGGHKLDGGIVISRGLLQISLESSIGYGCGLWEPAQLHKESLNLDCGLKILARQIKKKGMLTYDAGQYWAILKPSGKYGKIPQIKAMIGKLAFCH